MDKTEKRTCWACKGIAFAFLNTHIYDVFVTVSVVVACCLTKINETYLMSGDIRLSEDFDSFTTSNLMFAAMTPS